MGAMGSSIDALFVRSIVRDVMLLKPHQLGSNYREVIQAQLRDRLEGACGRHGFVLPGSIALQKVSHGKLEAATLNGDVRFDVHYFASVCNPPVGAVVSARAVTTNRFAVLAHAGVMQPNGDFLPVVEIIVAKQGLDVQSEIDLEEIKPGDVMNVEVVGKRFQLNDDRISVIGRAVAKPSAAVRAGRKGAAVLGEEPVSDGDEGDDGAATEPEVDVEEADADVEADAEAGAEADAEADASDDEAVVVGAAAFRKKKARDVDAGDDDEEADDEEGAKGGEDEDAEDDADEADVVDDDDDSGIDESDAGSAAADSDKEVVVVKVPGRNRNKGSA